MTKIKFVTGITFAVICTFIGSLTIHAQSTADAVAYMDEIGEQYQRISKEMWDYTSTMAHSRSARKVEKKRIQLLNTVKDAKYAVKKIGAFDKDYSLRDSVVAFLSLNYDVLNNDFEKIVDMEEVAEQSYDLMEAYLLASEMANEKLDLAADRMEIQYEGFAEKYGVKLIDSEDKISKKLKQSSEVMKYYNQVYLVFFKAYKQEIYLLDALQGKDINAIEQNRNALLSFSDEGLTKLPPIGHYKGDNSVNAACKRMLNFYKDEAETNIPVLADFIMTANKYEEMVALFESKDRMLLTNDEVNEYNKAADTYKKGINKFNSTINSMNTRRNNNLNTWNNAVNSFMTRHIPKK